MLDTEQGLIGTLEYNTDLFNADHHPDAGTFPNPAGALLLIHSSVYGYPVNAS